MYSTTENQSTLVYEHQNAIKKQNPIAEHHTTVPSFELGTTEAVPQPMDLLADLALQAPEPDLHSIEGVSHLLQVVGNHHHGVKSLEPANYPLEGDNSISYLANGVGNSSEGGNKPLSLGVNYPSEGVNCSPVGINHSVEGVDYAADRDNYLPEEGKHAPAEVKYQSTEANYSTGVHHSTEGVHHSSGVHHSTEGGPCPSSGVTNPSGGTEQNPTEANTLAGEEEFMDVDISPLASAREDANRRNVS